MTYETSAPPRRRRYSPGRALGIVALALAAGCGPGQQGTEPELLVAGLGDVTGFDVDADGLVWLDGDVFQAGLSGGQGQWLGSSSEGCAVQQADGVVYVAEPRRVHYFTAGLNPTVWSAPTEEPHHAKCESLVVDATMMQFSVNRPDGSSLQWSAVGSADPPSWFELSGVIQDATFDEQASFLLSLNSNAGSSSNASMIRLSRDDHNAELLTDGRPNPQHLVQQGDELFWVERNGLEMTFRAMAKTGSSSTRIVAVEERGCGFFTNLVAHGQHLYYGGNQALAGEDCSDGHHSISRVPMAGGAPEVVVARSSMQAPRWLRIHNGTLYFVDCANGVAPCAIKSVLLP